MERNDRRSYVLQDDELGALRFVGGGQFCDQRTRATEMGESIRATEATYRPLPGDAIVVDGLGRVLGLVEVDRKLRGDRLAALAVGGLETLGSPSMPNPFRCGRDPGQRGVPIERVDEYVVRLNRPIRPRL